MGFSFLEKKKIFNIYLIGFFMKKYKVFRSVGFQEEIVKYDKNIKNTLLQ